MNIFSHRHTMSTATAPTPQQPDHPLPTMSTQQPTNQMDDRPRSSESAHSAPENRYYRLKWSEHNEGMAQEFYRLYQDGKYTDVTIATDDESFHCHQIVLSACSPYFRSIFDKTDCKSPVIVMSGVSAELFVKLLRYMYVGEVEVPNEDLKTFLNHASYMEIR